MAPILLLRTENQFEPNCNSVNEKILRFTHHCSVLLSNHIAMLSSLRRKIGAVILNFWNVLNDTYLNKVKGTLSLVAGYWMFI